MRELFIFPGIACRQRNMLFYSQKVLRVDGEYVQLDVDFKDVNYKQF